MRYRDVLALLTAVLVAAEATRADSSATAARRPPNFLIVIGDDCTYKDLPLYGGQNVKTPNIDRLAAEGLTFDSPATSGRTGIRACIPALSLAGPAASRRAGGPAP